MTTPSEKAADIFGQKFNCSQAVFSAFASQFGVDEETALKLASPFGGGVARQGEVCGVVTGALLAIGLARSAGTAASNPDTYRLSQDFLHKFEEAHGSILCRNLIHCDISNPAGYQAAADKGVFVTICPGLVRDAVETVQAVLEIA
jgi:C_GCAxxG_C_C family probable redox protein